MIRANIVPLTWASGSVVGPHRYRITVAGRLDAVGQEALGDLCVDFDDANTVLSGELDQAALYGVLHRILALDLELVTVSRVADDPPNGQARNACGEPS